MTPPGRLVGSWTTRSGNSCDVYLAGGLDGLGALSFSWDRLPLSTCDVQDYERGILPAVVHLVGELLERPGNALVIRA